MIVPILFQKGVPPAVPNLAMLDVALQERNFSQDGVPVHCVIMYPLLTIPTSIYPSMVYKSDGQPENKAWAPDSQPTPETLLDSLMGSEQIQVGGGAIKPLSGPTWTATSGKLRDRNAKGSTARSPPAVSPVLPEPSDSPGLPDSKEPPAAAEPQAPAECPAPVERLAQVKPPDPVAPPVSDLWGPPPFPPFCPSEPPTPVPSPGGIGDPAVSMGRTETGPFGR
ncbi:sulfated surface glycoprotein 185-like [Belonocnema kinseyi]|uniref:sulfated surface glycoprotein 185-like n=1 Tax=Belonocnema kinseyi TaxID=2817044 RepID=UPI00143D28EE|nr:sulfated surface glycoprotein 185-like [Belonocnema kinseyi]